MSSVFLELSDSVALQTRFRLLPTAGGALCHLLPRCCSQACPGPLHLAPVARVITAQAHTSGPFLTQVWLRVSF